MGKPDQHLGARGPLGLDSGDKRIVNSRVQAMTSATQIKPSKIRLMFNRQLIDTANRLNTKFLKAGPVQQAAIAKTLLAMHTEMDARIKKAPMVLILKDKNDPYGGVAWLPKLEGVKWDPDDPLAGIVEGISPFSMIDWWVCAQSSEKASSKRRRSKTRASKTQRINFSNGSSVTGKSGGVGPKPSSPGIGKGMESKKEGGSVVGNMGGVAVDVALDIVPLIGLIKTAYDLLTGWINALRSGIEKSARNLAILVFNDALASMAVKIADKANARIPEPDDTLILRALKKKIAQWQAPSDRLALKLGRQKGLKFAKDYINGLEKRKAGSGVRYLRWLKQKYKGNRVDIGRAVYQELKKRGVELEKGWR